VTTGYLGNAPANDNSFANGWFRTGDLGLFDQDGYLTLLGRLKDQINKGGMKISPLEVEEAILTHPDVSEAAAFGVPHPTLGESVAAAVVLHPGAVRTSADLRSFLLGHLASFKIPQRIWILDQLPKGATGKLRRRHLGEVLLPGANAPSQVLPPEDRLEVEIGKLWSKLLGRDHVNYNDDFFEIGGDSLIAVQMLLEIERITGQLLPDTVLFDEPTVRQLARRLNRLIESNGKILIEVQRGLGGQPFIFFHGSYSTGGYYARRLILLNQKKMQRVAIGKHLIS
jgi:acyl carrier protein